MIVMCTLPVDWKPEDFDPFPGGKMAREMGCACPYQPLETGNIAFDSDCKVHPPGKTWRPTDTGSTT